MNGMTPVQHNTVEYNAAQCSAVQDTTVRDKMKIIYNGVTRKKKT